MAMRFLPDGRLRMDGGATLDRGADWLTREEAVSASRVVDSIVHREYPSAQDITGDVAKVRSLLARVSRQATDVGARGYSGSGLTVLTLEEFH